jgi:SAM-dependent methyltransferase
MFICGTACAILDQCIAQQKSEENETLYGGRGKMTEIYDIIGKNYAAGRRADPHIAAQIHAHLQNATSVVNIGAGTGSYEPKGVQGMAVEPSVEMISQRPADAFPVLRARAESLPFADKSFSHAMTVLSMHHWADRESAFREIRRVTRERFVAVSWNPQAEPFWLTRDYFPEISQADRMIFPGLRELNAAFPRMAAYPLNIRRIALMVFLAPIGDDRRLTWTAMCARECRPSRKSDT